MSPRDERQARREALLAACAAAISVASCGDPLPAVTFEEWVTEPPLAIHRCDWKKLQGREPAIQCSLTLKRPTELNGLSWKGYSWDGRAVAFGGTAFTPWKPGEERRVTFELDKRTGEPVARIKIEPF